MEVNRGDLFFMEVHRFIGFIGQVKVETKELHFIGNTLELEPTIM